MEKFQQEEQSSCCYRTSMKKILIQNRYKLFLSDYSIQSGSNLTIKMNSKTSLTEYSLTGRSSLGKLINWMHFFVLKHLNWFFQFSWKEKTCLLSAVGIWYDNFEERIYIRTQQPFFRAFHRFLILFLPPVYGYILWLSLFVVQIASQTSNIISETFLMYSTRSRDNFRCLQWVPSVSRTLGKDVNIFAWHQNPMYK